MAKNTPQNPIFPVDPSSLEVCLPKALCAECGTVYSVRVSPKTTKPQCPCCGAPMVKPPDRDKP